MPVSKVSAAIQVRIANDAGLSQKIASKSNPPSPGSPMKDIYISDDYLRNNPSWHEEDSAWKSRQILKMLGRNSLKVASVAEIGCGVGEILVNLSGAMGPEVQFSGYDIAQVAIARAKQKERAGLQFWQKDMLAEQVHFDLLLVIDVVEHVRDYYGFLERCRGKATHTLFHIPLDLHVSSVLRGTFGLGRKSIGHIHYFSEESAIQSLEDCGYTIVDAALTDGAVALAALHPSLKRRLANIPRQLMGLVSRHLSARLVGGYSLLVLCK